MAKIKLTKSAIDAAKPQAQPVELRDTLVPGFLCKITPAGRKVFMLQYRTNAGERRKPALGMYGELTVEQARSLAQNWLAEVRRGRSAQGADSQGAVRKVYGGLLQAPQQAQYAERLPGQHRPQHYPDPGADEGPGCETR